MSQRKEPSPVEQFLAALHAGDVDRVRRLLDDHEEVRAAVNAPIGHFDSRPVEHAKKNLPLLDLLLAYKADLNLKSAWWAHEAAMRTSRSGRLADRSRRRGRGAACASGIIAAVRGRRCP